MRSVRRNAGWVSGLLVLCSAFHAGHAVAQSDGRARLQATILDYNGSSAKHWTVAWVTTASGTFIKTLWKQGPSITKSHWNSHCGVWYSAKAGSTVIDGFSGATATSYTGNNSPIDLTWDCRNASGTLVPDGEYKFWVQYAEDSGQGPCTTGGLIWTKGPSSTTFDYSNQGANFAGMHVTWSSLTPPEPPLFAEVYVHGDTFHVNGTGTVNQTFYVIASTNIDLPVEEWIPVSTNEVDSIGSFTNTFPAASPQMFYRILLP